HDGHDLRARDDHEPLLAGGAGVQPSEPHDDVAQGAIVHVDRAGPSDAAGVETERVAVMQMRIQHRRQQVVGARDRVEVAREVQVDVFHRDDLGVPAAGGSTLHAEDRSERRRASSVVGWPMPATDAPGARASASATARTKAGSLRFPRWGTGARYGPSVSTSRRSGGQAVRQSVIAQFLKVIMPLKEKYAAIAIPAANTPGPELNECSTTGVSAPRSIAATSSSASRACTTTGFRTSRARVSWASKARRCASRGEWS